MPDEVKCVNCEAPIAQKDGEDAMPPPIGHQSYDGLGPGPTESEERRSWSVSREMTSGNASITTSLQALFAKAEVFTASFSLVPIDDVIGVTTAPLKAEALIEWAVDGNTNIRKISVTNGASIQGTSKSCRIVVSDVTVPVGGAVVLGKRYTVTITITPGPRGAYETPPIYAPFDLIKVIGGGKTQILIPQNVGIKTLLVVVASQSGVPILPQQAVALELDAASLVMCVFDPLDLFWVPLTPGAIYLQLKNFSGQDLFFKVFFGIDG
jgi:hypothetical protein